jgi:hypothetical protein
VDGLVARSGLRRDIGKLLLKTIEIQGFGFTVAPRVVPVRHLDTNEHPDHDNDEVDAYGDPVLVADMLRDAAQDHV